jgi:hypothetical protein
MVGNAAERLYEENVGNSPASKRLRSMRVFVPEVNDSRNTVKMQNSATKLTIVPGGNNKTIFRDYYGSRPGSKRLGALGSMVLNYVGQKLFEQIPDYTGPGYLPDIVTAAKNAMRNRFMVFKHNGGKVAFKNPIKGVNKFIQNFWSLGHLQYGLTDIEHVYTRVEGGNEIPYQIEARGRRENFENFEKHSNRETVSAGVYAELTDEDILQRKYVPDVTRFMPSYMKAEIWLFGQKGEKTDMGNIGPEGERVFRYSRPSKWDFFRLYTDMDIFYSVYTGIMGAAEKRLPGLAGQRVYEREAQSVIRRTCINHEPKPDNPFNYLIGV